MLKKKPITFDELWRLFYTNAKEQFPSMLAVVGFDKYGRSTKIGIPELPLSDDRRDEFAEKMQDVLKTLGQQRKIRYWGIMSEVSMVGTDDIPEDESEQIDGRLVRLSSRTQTRVTFGMMRDDGVQWSEELDEHPTYLDSGRLGFAWFAEEGSAYN